MSRLSEADQRMIALAHEADALRAQRDALAQALLECDRLAASMTEPGAKFILAAANTALVYAAALAKVQP